MTEALLAALEGLQEELRRPRFALPDPAQPDRRALRDRLVSELDGHIARVRHLDAPLLAVLGGGSGAGKSTVANSLVGQAVAATGVIRPTTSSPTLLVDPVDADWFTDDRILPGYARAHRVEGGDAGREPGRVLHLVTSHAIPPGLAILDAPDIDSVRTENRALADELLDTADVWLWFVTDRTYADEAGMAYLRRAARRRTALAVVLTQVHERDAAEVLDDLRGKLADEGLAVAARGADAGKVALLVVPQATVQGQRLPERAVGEVRDWLRSLATVEARDTLRRQTLDGALDDLEHAVGPLLAALEAEAMTAAALRADAAAAYRALTDRFTEALEDGPPLRQEVVARWSAFVGTNRFLSLVESATTMVRGWVSELLTRRTSAEQQRLQRQVRAEVADTLAALVVECADLAAADATAAWDGEPAGRRLLDDHPELRRASGTLPARAEEAVIAWQDAVAELIRTKGESRRWKVRWVSTLLNAAATAAILLTFASTGGLTGAEAGLAAGASAANQALLVKLLGAQNLNWVLSRAREDLLGRVARLGEDEQARYEAVVAGVADDGPTATDLRTLLSALQRARG